MEIVQRRELWIHTHFVTDCVRLPYHSKPCALGHARIRYTFRKRTLCTGATE